MSFQGPEGDDIRRDFISIGHVVTLYGIILVLLSGLIFWSLFVGGILIVAGLIYILAGIILKRPVAKPESSLDATRVERAGGSKTHTGPGWHCTWCWGPLPKDAVFCPSCGRELP